MAYSRTRFNSQLLSFGVKGWVFWVWGFKVRSSGLNLTFKTKIYWKISSLMLLLFFLRLINICNKICDTWWANLVENNLSQPIRSMRNFTQPIRLKQLTPTNQVNEKLDPANQIETTYPNQSDWREQPGPQCWKSGPLPGSEGRTLTSQIIQIMKREIEKNKQLENCLRKPPSTIITIIFPTRFVFLI